MFVSAFCYGEEIEIDRECIFELVAKIIQEKVRQLGEGGCPEKKVKLFNLLSPICLIFV